MWELLICKMRSSFFMHGMLLALFFWKIILIPIKQHIPLLLSHLQIEISSAWRYRYFTNNIQTTKSYIILVCNSAWLGVYLSEFWQCPRQDCIIQDWLNMPTPSSSSFLKTDSTSFFPRFHPITQIANLHILLSHPSFHILLPT